MSRKLINSGVEWILDYPTTWKIVRFKDIYSSKKEIVGEKAKDFERLSLTLNGVLKREKDDSEGLQPKDFYIYQILRKNDMVFKMIDLKNISTSRVGLSPYDGLVSPAYLRFKPKGIPNEFMYYYFMSLYYNNVFNHIAGDGVRSALNATDIGNIKCPFPPFQEQLKIVEELKEKIMKIDSLILNQENEISLLEDFKIQLISKEVYQKENKNRISINIDGLNSIPSDWKIFPLKQLFTLQKGLPITKDNLIKNGISVISYGQIHAKYNKSTYITDELFRFVEESYLGSNPECLVKQHDYIFADTSEDLKGVGDFIHIDRNDNIFAGYHSIILKNKGVFNPYYMAYQFMTNEWRCFFRCRVGGVKLFSLTKKLLNQGYVVLPPISVQSKIVKILDEKCKQIDKLVQLKKAKIEKIKEYKKSLIYEYVTGKR